MIEHDMPANDAARFGGPSGWRVVTRDLDLGTKLGVAIEGYDASGRMHRHAIRISPDCDPSSAMPILAGWVAEMESIGWNRHKL